MKKIYKEKYSKKVNKKKSISKRNIDIKWVSTITITAFFISILFSFLSEIVVSNVTAIVSIILILLVILLGVVFDMIGIAVTVSDIATFNSMATKKVKGSSLAVRFIKNSEKMSSFCNDVIGDICGIISGALSASISLIIAKNTSINIIAITLIVTGLVASLTIGGKAMGKSIAINKSNYILYKFSRIISFFYKK